MSDPEVTSVDPTVLIDRASQGKAQPAAKPGSQSPAPKASEVVSVDPTELIDRASQSATPEPVDPTVLVQHEQAPRRPAPAPHRQTPPYRHEEDSVAVDPTVLISPRSRQASAPQKPAVSRGPATPSLWARLTTSTGRSTTSRPPAPTRGGDRWSPTTRGILLAVAAVAGAGLLVWAGVVVLGWLFTPGGKLLTVTKPEHGTIEGGGVECGSKGSKCSTTVSDGEMVQLTAVADEGYAFREFTGPCAPSGRVLMSAARTCGATFDGTPPPPPPVTWPLTIEKPTGGTITFAPDIVCGTLDSRCSASLQNGQLVRLDTAPDPGFKALRFTGACAPDGVTTMTEARTCGATFAQAAAAPVVHQSGSGGGRSPSGPGVILVPTPEKPPQPVVTPPLPQGPSPAGGAQPGQAQTPTQTPPQIPTLPGSGDKPVTPEEHAQKEIKQLVTQYCKELQTLDPARIQKLYPNVDLAVLKDRFRQYKSLQCEVTAPPEGATPAVLGLLFERLDASPAGGAQVKFGMKQVIQMRSGGAPATQETVVTMVVSRMSFQDPWLIDRVQHVAKPKP